MESRRAKALFPYKQKRSEEISFQSGEVLTLLDDTDPKWWKGENAQARVGLFPSKYVEKLEGEKDPANWTIKVRVVFDHEKSGHNELEVKKGDRVLVRDVNIDEDWWEGELNGYMGYFPRAYVELIPSSLRKVHPSRRVQIPPEFRYPNKTTQEIEEIVLKEKRRDIEENEEDESMYSEEEEADFEDDESVHVEDYVPQDLLQEYRARIEREIREKVLTELANLKVVISSIEVHLKEKDNEIAKLKQENERLSKELNATKGTEKRFSFRRSRTVSKAPGTYHTYSERSSRSNFLEDEESKDIVPKKEKRPLALNRKESQEVFEQTRQFWSRFKLPSNKKEDKT